MAFINALCHLNATPLSVAVLAPCAWGENLVCGVARRCKFGKASVAKMWRCLWAKRPKRKWSSVWAGDFSLSLSLVARAFRLCVKFTRLFTYSNFKAKIQIFHSKFKAFCKFNSFYNFISNFKPYTRLFHIFTPNFLYFHSNRFQNFEKSHSTKDKQ